MQLPGEGYGRLDRFPRALAKGSKPRWSIYKDWILAGHACRVDQIPVEGLLSRLPPAAKL